MVSAELERFGYPVEDFDLETPAELRLFQWYFAGTREDAAPGYFDISFYPKVKGVTVYGHILDAVRHARRTPTQGRFLGEDEKSRML